MFRISPFLLLLVLLLLVLIGAAGSARASASPQNALLLHYSFDDGRGTTAPDTSGNGLNGVVSAAWTDSPSGKSLSFDGTPNHIVSVKIPAGRRFGKGSWTFSAWLKPMRLTIDDPQNQRRIFSFGTFPAANLVIDLLASGQVSYYFCYRRGGTDTIISTGGSSAAALKTGQWAHVAVVCDRKAGQVEIYINGFSQGETALPPGFAGDFSINGDLTLGSPWHNYWGLMDEVRIYRRALSRAEVRAEFDRLQKTFGVTLTPELEAAEKQETLMEAFAKSHDAWAARNFAAVRAACDAVIDSQAAPASLRSYAELRKAQSLLAEGKPRLAEAEYARIAANADYPEVHRAAARERIAELARVARGLPARDPAASRTVILPITHFAARVFVSSRGSDANDGSEASPVASLARARDLVRALKGKGVRGAIEVNVQPGEYPVTAPLALTAQDSGTPDAPVVYRSVQPGKAVFYGGRRITGFRPVTDPAILDRLPEKARGHVLYCDLRAQGITDYGHLAVRGFGQPPSPPTLELFVNGKPMTLARWPNKGFVGISKLVEPGSRAAGKPSIFEYTGDRPARWTKARDAWLFGYFRYLWADGTIKVAKIDPVAHTITTAEAYQYGQPGMDNGQGIQYYAFNLLEEIDEPGEWYLDRETGVLYLYAPTDLTKAAVEIGMLSTPMVTMDHVTDVRMEGLDFDLARFNGLVLTGCSRCLVAGCVVSRMAGDGISIDGGEADGILGCDIFCIGRRATEVIGGDRETLTPGRHFVENCRIHDFGRIDRTYTPAIQLEGVGNRVAHNQMYDCPSSVMRIEGNDHVIEYNEVFNAVQESDDQGAMELFGNPTYRGVVFRYNRFTNCGKVGGEKEVVGQAAIRFDDAISGMTVYGNVFINSANGHFGAVQMNSGRDNIMDNNLFIDCKQGISGGWYPGNSVWSTVASGKLPPEFIENALYLKRYPEIATMLKEPGINHVWRNVFYRCGPMVTGNRANLDLVENGVFDKDPGFVDAAKGDYHLKPNAALFADVGFDPIPLDEIGLYTGRYRAKVEIPPDPAAMEVRLDPPATVCFTPQTAVVHVTNNSGAPVTLGLALVIGMPFGGTQQRVAAVTVAAHDSAEAKMLYEIYEPGRHTFTVTASEGGREVATTETVVEVPAEPNAPWRFPNYYRQELRTETGGKILVHRHPGAADVVPKPADVHPLVGIGADNRLRKNGRPWFPIGIYFTPSSERSARELADAGFDLVTVGVMPPAQLRHLLDLLQGWGLNAWVPVSDLLQFADGDVAKKKAELSALVAGVGDHPALALWESMDEPAWNGQPAWGLREGYRFLRALDPRRPIWTNHAPRNRVQTLAFFNQATDIAGCDIYPVPTPQTQSDLPNKTLGVVGDETAKNILAVRDEKPVFMVLQGFAWRSLNNRADPEAVYPTLAQSRFMAYDAIIAGASGILYWGVNYTPRPSPFWSNLKSVVSELHGLKPFLEAPRKGVEAAITPTGSPVRCLARRVNGRVTLLLVNRSEKEAMVKVTVTGAHGPWRCLFGDPAPRAAGQGLALKLPPWSARAVTDDPDWNPVRRDYSAEARTARPPQPLPTEPGNAIPNPGFEADDDGAPAGWDVRMPFTVFRDTTVKHSGEASLRIESPAAGATPLAVMQSIVVKPDKEYRLTGWMRSDTPGVKARIYAEWNDATGWHSYVLPWVQPTTGWREWSVDVATANNPEGLLYVVAQAQDKGRVWFDDLKLAEVTSPVLGTP